MAGMARGLMARASTRALLASNDPAALGLQVASVCNCSTPPTRRAENKKSEKKSKQTRSAYREVPAEPVAVQSDHESQSASAESAVLAASAADAATRADATAEAP